MPNADVPQSDDDAVIFVNNTLIDSDGTQLCELPYPEGWSCQLSKGTQEPVCVLDQQTGGATDTGGGTGSTTETGGAYTKISDCDDQNDCTTDNCASSICSHEALNEDQYNDGNQYTPADLCINDQYQPGSQTLYIPKTIDKKITTCNNCSIKTRVRTYTLMCV